MTRVDYSEISKVYDQARPRDSPHLERWFNKIAELGELGPGRRLIDLGCGTGRWTLSLAERTGCQAVGLDNSPEMLKKAREKDPVNRVSWLLGDVEHLAVEPESFDCALLVLMLHHIDDPLAAFRGVFRALRPRGIFLIRQGTLEQILDDVEHRFFPETLTIDRQRTPFSREVEGWLSQTGFGEIEREEVLQTSYVSDDDLLKVLHLRVASALRLIDNEAFESGLRRAEEYIRQNPDELRLRQERLTLFSATRPMTAGSARRNTS